MTFTRRLAVLLLVAVLLAATFTACKKTDPASQHVATVGNEVVTYAEYQEMLASYCSYYGIVPAQLDDYVGVESANELRRYIVDSLVSEKVMLQKAAELGLDAVSEAQQSEIEERAAQFFDELRRDFFKETPAEEQAAKEDEYQAYLAQNGYTETYVHDYYRHSLVLDNVYLSIVQNVTVEEQDIADTYQALLQEQQSLNDTDMATACYNYINDSNAVDVYIPTGIRRVKHILIGFDKDTKALLDNIQDAATYESEYNAALQKLLPSAQSVLNKLNNGAAWAMLSDQHNTDPGMQQEPYASQGYEVYPGAPFVKPFLDAALALQNPGEHTDLVPSEFGYHIIRYEQAVPGGAVPLADIHDDISAIALSDKQTAVWTNTLAQWQQEIAIEIFSDRFLTPAVAQ